MRIAIMADIHGNILALDAVLNDINSDGGVDEYWVLGDLVALGPAPIEVLERLSTFSNVRCIRGNTDRYVCTEERPPPSIEDVKNNPALLQVLVEVTGSFAWTQGAVTQAGWFEWHPLKSPLYCQTAPECLVPMPLQGVMMASVCIQD